MFRRFRAKRPLVDESSEAALASTSADQEAALASTSTDQEAPFGFALASMSIDQESPQPAPTTPPAELRVATPLRVGGGGASVEHADDGARSPRSRSPPPVGRARASRRSSIASNGEASEDAPRRLVRRRSSAAAVGDAVRRRRSSAAAAGRQSVSARARRSFAHRDFANPQAETCWLSCLFQSLWHSVVFHSVFERYLASPKYFPEEDEDILRALQQTWSEYHAAEEQSDVEQSNSAPQNKEPCDEATSDSEKLAQPLERCVSAEDLAVAFGDGYGDMSEALAIVQEELSQSPNLAAAALAGFFALVPVAAPNGDFPNRELAWQQVQEWKMEASPLLAVDIGAAAAAPPSREDSARLASLWMPIISESSNGCSGCDLGQEHRLVALVCFMWNIQHYVAFIRRQRDPSRCLFFNDLPDLTTGAAREVNWSDVPEMCGNYGLTPRLALYEATAAAEQAARDPSSLLGCLAACN